MKNISSKNYFVVFMVSIIVIILTLYVRSFYISYLESIKNSSVFSDKSVSQMNQKDIDYVLSETSQGILYISYTGDRKIYNMEKRLYREFEKRNVLDKVIYWNVIDDNNYIDKIKSVFPNIKTNINKAPLIIYIENGNAIDVINNDDNIISKTDVDNLLTKYEIE